MYKEMIISIILVALIFIGDYVTQGYTDRSISSFKEELQVLKNKLIDSNEEASEEDIDSIENKWENIQNKMSYYIEHEELEKVDTYLTECSSFTKSGNYAFAINSLEKTDFILEHINEKYSFNLENIF